MTQLFRIAVLVSGEGTNLQAIIDHIHGRDGVAVVAVASDKDDAPALGRAERAAIPTAVFVSEDYQDRVTRDRALAEWLRGQAVDLVVLAGYMQLLSTEFLHQFPNAVINIHPSLLPDFPGLNAIEQAVAAGKRVFGVTVHYVDEGVDSGPIIAQRELEPPDPTDVEGIRARLHALEHELLPEVIHQIGSTAR